MNEAELVDSAVNGDESLTIVIRVPLGARYIDALEVFRRALVNAAIRRAGSKRGAAIQLGMTREGVYRVLDRTIYQRAQERAAEREAAVSRRVTRV